MVQEDPDLVSYKLDIEHYNVRFLGRTVVKGGPFAGLYTR